MFREGQGNFPASAAHRAGARLLRHGCSGGLFCRSSQSRTWYSSADWAPADEGVPFVNISGGFNIGNNFEGELPQSGNTFQWSDNFSKTIGKHDFKFGGDIRYQRFDQTLYFDVNGQYFYFGGGPNDPRTIRRTLVSQLFAGPAATNTDKGLRSKSASAPNRCTCSRKTAGRSGRT